MPSIEEVRASRPPEPGFARTLLIMAAVLWFVVTAHVYYYEGAGLVAVALVLVVFGSFGAVKGRQAGRVMATVAVGVTYFFLLPYCWVGFRDPYPGSAAMALVDIAAVVLSAIALVQLFHPNTNRYIHLVSVAMRSR